MNIKQKAVEIRERQGGTIFAFPIDEQAQFPKYAIVMYAGGQYHEYPEATHISEAAVGVQTLLEQLQKRGIDASFEKDVRFISYQTQLDAPDVTMRRLKKGNGEVSLEKDKDVTSTKEGYALSARGMIKFSYFEMLDSKNLKATLFMKRYYELLSKKKYGKTAAAIKQEVHRMNKDEGSKWIERTYKRYIHNGDEIWNIFNSLSQ